MTKAKQLVARTSSTRKSKPRNPSNALPARIATMDDLCRALGGVKVTARALLTKPASVEAWAANGHVAAGHQLAVYSVLLERGYMQMEISPKLFERDSWKMTEFGRAKHRKPNAAIGQDLESWLAGYEAGSCRSWRREPIEPPKKLGTYVKTKTDTQAWLAGYVEGAAQTRGGQVLHGAGTAASNASEDCGIGVVAYVNGFKAGMRLAARQAWKA